MRYSRWPVTWVLLGSLLAMPSVAGPATAAVRGTADIIMTKFGKGAAGQTIEEVTETTARAVARNGEDAPPLVRRTGHQGLAALEQAGGKSPDVIKLYARKGEEAAWVISEPKKLSIFLKHGYSAADAMIRHPGIADDLIERFGDEAVGALNVVSRQGAQRLGIAAKDGLLTATRRSPELLSVVRHYGDEAMNFIWENKGALVVTAVLGSFLADPQAYFSGAKQLIIDPVVGPIVSSTNWTWIIATMFVVILLPFLAHQISVVREVARKRVRRST